MGFVKKLILVSSLFAAPVFAQNGNAGNGNSNSSGNGNGSGNGSGNTIVININIGCIACGGGSAGTSGLKWHPPLVPPKHRQ